MLITMRVVSSSIIPHGRELSYGQAKKEVKNILINVDLQSTTFLILILVVRFNILISEIAIFFGIVSIFYLV